MAGLVFRAEGGRVGFDAAKLHDLRLELAVEPPPEGRDLAPVGVGAGLLRGRVRVAMFSAITRMRPDWTLRPDAATEIVLRKSMAYFPRPTAVRSICRLF